jgi:hypothetical protein
VEEQKANKRDAAPLPLRPEREVEGEARNNKQKTINDKRPRWANQQDLWNLQESFPAKEAWKKE